MSEGFTSEERIHRYLMNEMTGSEKAAFEQDCAADPALREALELERKVMALVRHDARTDLKKMLQTEDEEKSIPLKPRSRKWVPWVAMTGVAAAVLLIVINLTTTRGFYEEPPSDLFYGTERGTPSPGGDELAAVREAYLQHEYAKALELMGNVKLPEGEAAQNANFIAAHCLWHLKRYPEAAERFRALRDLTPPGDKLYRYTWWYHVLALREAGETEKAGAELQQLHDQQYNNMDADLRQKVDRLMGK